MVVYFYLSIIIVFSIFTGIIVTIVEKIKAKRKKYKIQSIDLPIFVYSNNKSFLNNKKSQDSVSKTFLSKTIEIMDLTKKVNQMDLSNKKSYYSKPIISSILDEDII